MPLFHPELSRTACRVLIPTILLIIVLAAPPCLSQVSLENRIYATLLEKHVKGRRVDYDGFKQDEALLDQYLSILAGINPDQLSHNRQFAFYINLYNASTIKLILTHYPGINSIKEVGSFFSGPWSRKFIPLKGRKVSLDYIEHQVLRPRFKDPRVHFAINCAAKSCPPLFNRPFEGKDLDYQLDDLTRLFINDRRATFLKGDTLFVSKIFKWFGDDFNNNTSNFIRQYADDKFKARLDSLGPGVKVKYLHYDWSLNRR